MKIEIAHPGTGQAIGTAEIEENAEILVGLMTGFVTDRESGQDTRPTKEVGASLIIAGLSEADVMALPSRWFVLVPITPKES